MWNQLADNQTLETTIEALKQNNIDVIVAENGMEAKKKVLEILPENCEVMTMTSTTCDIIGLTAEINNSTKYNSVKNKLMKMDRATQKPEMQKLGSAPEYTIGSVHAVTQDGKVLIASQSGSQLPAYIYGSSHVIWIVGTQKIVKNTDEAMKRIYEYVLPLENERAQKVYGKGSAVNKLLIINKEIIPQRLTMILAKEPLGF